MLDVYQQSTENSANVVQWSWNEGDNQQWRFITVSEGDDSDDGDDGADSDSPVGFGEDATGGEGGTTVTVSDASDFLDYIGRSGAYVIRVNGTINISGMNDVASNKTIVGVGYNGVIEGGGLDIDGVDNVIVRNLLFQDAEVLVEGNYFQDVDAPTPVGYGSSDPGDLVEQNNVYSDSGSPEIQGSVPSPPYSYSMDDADSIPSIVSNGAGRTGEE